MAINHPDGLGVAYVSDYGDGKWRVVAYRGTAAKPSINIAYKTREQAEKNVEAWFTSLLARKLQVVSYRAEASKPTTLKVGDIVTNSWGYDQTNVDCYQVTRTTEHFVWIREIESKLTSGEGCSPMAGYVTPCPNQFREKSSETKHKSSGEYVTFRHGGSTKWDGVKKLYCSWYA
jgi:hypothetical protein